MVVMSVKNNFCIDGYAWVPQVFQGERLRELQVSFDEILLQIQDEETNSLWDSAVERLGAQERTIHHTHQVQAYSAVWLKAWTSPSFLEPVMEILGEDVVLHHSKLFHKPPRTGGPFPMHQDWQYFPSQEDTMIAGIIFLEDTDEANGCLRVEPGSHRLGRRRGMSGDASHGPEDRGALEQYTLDRAKPVPARAGDVLFFHYFTLHGSGVNNSDRPRKSVLVQMRSGGDAMEKPGSHPEAGVVLHGRDHTMSRALAGRL